MFLNIITPTRDGKNLKQIANSINIPKENYKWIIVFDSDQEPVYPEIDNAEFLYIKNDESISGNAQRNLALSKVEAGFIFFLDDDTVLHPLFWNSIKEITADIDFVSFDQAWCTQDDKPLTNKSIINSNKVVRTKGDNPQLDHIDSGNYIVNSRVAKNFTWQLDQYNADGLFCVQCYNSSTAKIYIPKILSIYNFLDTKRNYYIPFETGLVTAQGVFYPVDEKYYDYIDKVKHIYQQPQFGEPWFSNEELFSIMVECATDGATFVEVGSWKGKSSAYMAVEIANSRKNIQFYCVDTWQGSKEHLYFDLDSLFTTFTENMKPLKDYYRFIRMESCVASKIFKDNSLDFIYIDASHEYEDVKQDIIHWLPKLKGGGIIAGDDYGNPDFPGVHRAVFELLDGYEVKNSTWIFKK